MKKALTIAKYEFLKNVKRKEFLLMTFGFPLLVLLLMIVPAILISASYNGNQSVGYIDQANLFGEKSKILEKSKNTDSFGENAYTIEFKKYIDSQKAQQDLELGKISECIIIPSNYLKDGIIYYYAAGKMQSSIPEKELSDLMVTGLLSNKVEENVLNRVKNPVSMKRIDHLSNDNKFQEIKAEDIANLVLPLFSAIILFISIFSSSGYLLRSIAEEKENKMIEILLSSVTPQELLVGKIIGLGTVGLLQITTWISVIILGAIYYIAIYMKPSLLMLVLVYYILGYLLYASIMAGIGAIASGSLQEGQQISGIISLVALLPLLLIQILIANPNSGIAIFLSIFPLTSPISMMSRIAVTNVPFYQTIISILILFMSIYLEVALFSRIFRVEFLMYGKKPNINELIRYFFMK